MYSNCIAAALIAKLRDWKNVELRTINTGSWTKHWFWYDKKKRKSFTFDGTDPGPFGEIPVLRDFLYKGRIIRAVNMYHPTRITSGRESSDWFRNKELRLK
jgi:hypothetical protein